jgi:hypothetical protein
MTGRSGARLAALADVAHDTLLSRATCVNLLRSWPGTNRTKKGDLWPAQLARVAALTCIVGVAGARVILLGQNVARAFRVGRRPILTWFPFGHGHAAIVPHPSGINRWYNDPSNVRRAERFMRRTMEAVCASPASSKSMAPRTRPRSSTSRGAARPRRG